MKPQHLLRAAALTLLIAVPASKAEDTPKGDLAKLQGQWSGKIGIDKDIEIVLTVKGQAVTGKVTTADGRDLDLKGEIVLNEEAKPHKTIDWVKFTGPDGEAVGDNLGIYNFENGDTLTVCNGGPGNDRPSEFKAGEGGNPHVFSMKREKPVGEEKADDKDKDKDKPKGDLAKLQGTWSAKVGPNQDVELVLTIEGGEATFSMARDGQEFSFKGKVALDEAAKPHKAITFKGFTRPDGEEVPENLGIYEFEGNDTIKVCSGGPGNDRPSELKAGEGGPPTLMTMTRKAK